MIAITPKSMDASTRKAKETYQRLYTVCVAAGTGSGRYFLDAVLLEGGKAIATDGHRLHFASSEGMGIPDGLYKITKLTKTSIILDLDTDHKFPQWERVVPKIEDMEIVTTLKQDEEFYKAISVSMAELVRKGAVVNVGFLLDLATAKTAWTIYVSKENAKDTPVLAIAENNDVTAVIMPIEA